MKKVLITCAILALLTLESQARNIKFKVYKDGNYSSEVTAVKKSGILYMNFADIARMYGVLPHFYPVSKKAVIRFMNNNVEVFYNSEQIIVSNALKTLDVPTYSARNRLFAPVSLILSTPFSEVSKYNADLDARGRRIDLNRRISVRKPEIASFQNLTRIMINFDSIVAYKIFSDNKQSVVYEFRNGFCGKPYETAVDDGVIDTVSMMNHHANARLEIFLNEGAGIRKEYLFNKENILIIDVERTPLAQGKSQVLSRQAPPPEEFILTAIPTELIASKPPADASDEYGFVSETSDSSAAGEFAAAVAEGVEQVKEKVELAGRGVVAAVRGVSRGSRKPLIVLDPGHGGKDPGAIGAGGIKEKVLNLAVAKEMVPILRQNGYEVMLTRDDDTFVALMDRIEFANRVKADLFVSIHCNASLNPRKRGFEVYFLSEHASDPQAEATAKLENAVIALEGENKKRTRDIQEVLFSMAQNAYMNQAAELSALINNNMKRVVKMEQYDVRQAGFHVLRGAQMPAVLVECGYISNRLEERFIARPDTQKKLAEGITKGIMEYKAKRSNEK